jgi:hypothetical protein
VTDDRSTPRILSDLHHLLLVSRQQQQRLKEALTRVLSILDEADST